MAEKMEKTARKPQAAQTKKSGRKINWILYIAVVAFVLYIAVLIVDQNVKIQNKRETLSEKNNTRVLKEIENQELKQVAVAADEKDLDSVSDYIERIAREELDYVKNGERVFVNIAGD